MADILIIDDDDQLNKALTKVIVSLGHKAESSFTLKSGLDKISANSYDVVFLDVRMPDGSGLEILPRIKISPSSPEVIIITAFENENGASLAIKNGAWDYIRKPSSLNELKLSLARALQYRNLKNTKSYLLKREKIIGYSKRIIDALEQIVHVAPNETNVFLTGETGTGKELFAFAIHENSPRAGKNFVIVDCAALPETLVQSILFGYKKGAFTNAFESREGLISQANGGTLFLDEIGEMPLSIQKSFLRVIQERKFKPLGEKEEQFSDFRLVAATNKNLNEMVRQNKFREDLLYRINSFTIELPSLRERKEDIQLIFMHFMNEYCKKYSIPPKGYTPEFLQAINSFEWPGNVRELRNTVEQVLAVAGKEETLFPYHLPHRLRINLKQNIDIGTEFRHPAENSDAVAAPPEQLNFKDFRKEMERQYFKKLLKDTGNVKSKAIDISGLSRSRFFALLKKYDM